ncbi:hypothetical protein [Roseivivax marinus]|uniref:hypothetical protein n=1 Tax=Roseivivax marinus TaxID=1379903 RepID=UPI00273DB389|nr:hypothetical protein [Roseivivax marinus]
MFDSPKEFVAALGGYRAVAPRIGVRPTTLHSHIQAGALPAKQYFALSRLAIERGVAPPPLKIFSFVELKPARELTYNERGAA